MTLLSVETVAEFGCVLYILGGIGVITSGRIDKVTKTAVWCSTGKNVDLKWSNFSSNIDDGKPMCLHLGGSGLIGMPCDTPAKVMCESSCPATKSPFAIGEHDLCYVTAVTSTPIPRFTLSSGSKCIIPNCTNRTCPPATKVTEIVPSQAGTFVSGCNNLYHFSNVLVDRDEAESSCCRLGLKLLSQPETHQCLYNLFKEHVGVDSRYWLAARRVINDPECNSFWWCPSGSQVTFETGQKFRQDQDCLVLQLRLNVNKMELAAESCGNKQPYICNIRLGE